MTPTQAIAMLDRQIARHGQRVVLRRGQGTPVVTAGFIRGYKPEVLVGLITQADRNLTLSPTGLGSYVPAANDQVSLDGALGTLQSVEQIKIGSTVVRYNIKMRLT